MPVDWITLSWSEAVGVGLSVVVVYLSIILLTRLTGLRSFSKMAAPDFAMTVAIGSLLASAIISPDPSIGVALLALSGLFIGQYVLAYVRRRFSLARRVFDNEPLLLMDGSRMLEDNMRQANVSVHDIRAKLREANVFELDEVRAVVFETTGDVSVLHSSDPGRTLAADLLNGVRR